MSRASELDAEVNDRVVIQFSPAVRAETARSSAGLSHGKWKARLGLPKEVNIRCLGPNSARAGAADSLRTDRPVILQLNGCMTVAQAIARLQKHPDIATVERGAVGHGGSVPNDPNYSQQWHHQTIHSEGAWAITTGSSSIIVAVLDTGVAALPEFAGRMVPGHNDVANNTDTSDDNGHGTMVASVLAATGNNGALGAGMDWRCKIMPEKVNNSSNIGTYSNWATGIFNATDAGANVINLSSGGDADSTFLQSAIDYAIGKGVIFVTITENQGSNVISFPGRLPQCITVGGTNGDDTIATFSNYGPQCDLVAPAVNIFSTQSNGTFGSANGTSFAAPQVSGVASLLLSINRKLNQAAIEQILCASAEDQVGGAVDTPGFDQHFGYGRLNAAYALQLATVMSGAVQIDAGGVHLQWTGLPANAAQKQPFIVQYSTNLAGWTTAGTRSNVAYSGSSASWVDDGTTTGSSPLGAARRFYHTYIQR